MSNSAINFKVYCVDGDNSEVKRFSVDCHTVTSFVFMEEKLRTVFPNLRNGDFKINWKDADGDLITISNDEDIITALTEMTDNPRVLYINSATKTSTDQPHQFRVVCDVCQKGISGYRYKCIECPDYDLCLTCEGNGNHSEHMVLRFPNSNTSFAKIDRKMMHTAARALKKSVFQAHKCARNAFKAGEKEKPSNSEDECANSQNTSYGCPFVAADAELLTQNINPFIETFLKGASTSSDDQTALNPVADLIRSVVEKFTGSIIAEPNATAESKKTSSEPQKRSETQPDPENKGRQENLTQCNTQNNPPQTTEPSAPSAVSANTNTQDMEWTIVSDNDDSNSQASARSKTPTTQPPKPPQDPRLMRGLAQLHEMGFSNENNFLNYMLEVNDYNVSSVVKAILQLK